MHLYVLINTDACISPLYDKNTRILAFIRKNRLKYAYLRISETNTCRYAYKSINTHIQGTMQVHFHTYAYICSYARIWKTLRVHVLEITPTRIYARIPTYKRWFMHISTYMTKICVYWHVYGKNRLKYAYLRVNESNTCIYTYKCIYTCTLRVYCLIYAYIRINETNTGINETIYIYIALCTHIYTCTCTQVLTYIHI